MGVKVGRQSLQFASPPVINSAAAIVGPKEGNGPLAKTFDKVLPDSYDGEETWEKTERKILTESVQLVLQKANLGAANIDFFFAGDLLNQTITANFAARQLGIPFLGLYGACSTIVEGLLIGGIVIDGGFATNVVSAASSHYGTAERQYRFPTEQGVQRPLYAQWTVTGAGALLVSKEGTGPKITFATVGKVVDLGQKDVTNMGSAMAPAVVDTLIQHLQDTGRVVDYYDLIVTGDLAQVGKKVAQEMAQQKGYDLRAKHTDCGLLIYDAVQDTHAGGSGCGCVAVVMAGYLMQEMQSGKYNRILLIGTGALLSPTSVQQGDSIPAIAHAISIEN